MAPHKSTAVRESAASVTVAGCAPFGSPSDNLCPSSSILFSTEKGWNGGKASQQTIGPGPAHLNFVSALPEAMIAESDAPANGGFWQSPAGLAFMLHALDFSLEEPRRIVIAGDANSASAQALLRAAGNGAPHPSLLHQKRVISIFERRPAIPEGSCTIYKVKCVHA